MTGKLKDLTMNMDKSQNLTITINEDFREEYDKLKDDNITIEIKKLSGRRSMDANAYLWHLCSEIAKATSKYSTDGKNEIYREAIRAKGEFEPLLVREEAVDFFIKRWSEKGTGWFAEVVDDYVDSNYEFDNIMGDTKEKRKEVHAYYGSSTYDKLSMSRIIDYVVLIANDLGIPTMTEKEAEKLLTAWGKKVEKREQVNSSA